MLTMTSALVRAQQLFGAKAAVVDRERCFNWNESTDRMARLAAGLAGLGVGPERRFGILSANSFRYHEALHAGYWGGAVPVPINMRLAAPEIKFILDNAECSALILGDGFDHLLDSAELAPWRSKLVHLGADKNDGRPSTEELIAASPPARPHPTREEDHALILYTGGTTGRAKGVPLSHMNIVSNGLQVALAMKATVDDNYLHAAPMFHAADLLGTGFTLVGAAHSFLPAFTGDKLLRAIEGYRVTVVMLAPTMIIMTLQDDHVADHDLASWRLLFYGSSPMAAEWVQRTLESFKGVEVQQGYGLTETSPILTTLDPAEHRRAVETGEIDILRAAGRPLPGIEVRIVGEDGDLALGETGEVVVRGPNVTKGYLNRPEETAASFRNGWFHTGDVGRLDEHGYLFIQDRKKDMVVTGGENVYTSEVEAALYQHPGVHECAVVGVPDDKFGEALFAVIVPAPGAELDEQAIIEHCRGRIGSYKIPRRMAFVDEMPKSAMGKILKSELRQIYGGSENVIAAAR